MARRAAALAAQFGDDAGEIDRQTPLQPTLRTGPEALTAAALAWLAP
jgi:hypothetical protein